MRAMRFVWLAPIVFALAGCAAEREVPAISEASVAAGGEAPVIARLRTRSGVRDVTVDDLATSVDGHSIGTMRAWADTDPRLMRAPADDAPFDPTADHR